MGVRRAASAAFFLFLNMAWATPPLTTVQDVLYKADGSRFQGTALIEWTAFTASDNTPIPRQSLSLPIVDGNISVQLVPTTTARTTASYLVKYVSNGAVQFSERWYVPPSTSVVRLSTVRTATSSGGVGNSTGGNSTAPIDIGGVTGLSNELAIRPVKGTGFAPSRAIATSSTGAIEAVIGNLTDCVRVDGTAGPCGTTTIATGPRFVDGETPAGLRNGSNAVFTLAQPPSPATSLMLYRNGLLQRTGTDYTLSGTTITFTTASVPQTNDLLVAAYRLADANNPGGLASGALTGTYPAPLLADSIVGNQNVAAAAGIQESKLALNYPTHSAANDPTADQKAALTGTAGSPAAANKFVTDSDARLRDARAPLGHSLLGTGHSDTTPGVAQRGDLVVATGAPATWAKLPLGPANRCLMSNGSDAVWNTCLFTGFSLGTVPFIDNLGNLAQNADRLTWDNNNRRFSIGSNEGSATLLVHDAVSSVGRTLLTVRAGQAQSSTPLQSWQDNQRQELAQVDSEGRLTARRVRSTATAEPSWQEAGLSQDPSPATNGDAWFHTGQQTRRAVAGGIAHAVPQVICSDTGSSTRSVTLSMLSTCRIPAGLVQPGDRLAVRFDLSHEGDVAGFQFAIRWAGQEVVTFTGSNSDWLISGDAQAGVRQAGTRWSAQVWSTETPAVSIAGLAGSTSGTVLLELVGNLDRSNIDTLSLDHFTVVRYPAQRNP